MKRMNEILVAVVMLGAVGCGDDGGGTAGASEGTDATGATTTSASAGSESGEPTGTGESGEPTGTGESGEPTGTGESGEPTTTTGADTGVTTGEVGVLTPAQLVGSFASAGCESYPNGMGGNNYLTRSFTLTEASWHLDLVLFADEACTTKLFSAVIDGPYVLLGASATVDGATEGDFSFTTIVWTAHLQVMADTFTMSGCGAAPWEIEVPQDVTETGCIGVAHPIAECPTEHDVVALTGDDLYFGERITDMCSEAGRPAALGAYPVVRI